LRPSTLLDGRFRFCAKRPRSAVHLSIQGLIGRSHAVQNLGGPRVGCASSATYGPRDDIEETAPTPQAGLRYEPAANQYVYVWPTDKAWAPTCRMVTLTLNDGTTHSTIFQLTK
jgi:hypothetical protein